MSRGVSAAAACGGLVLMLGIAPASAVPISLGFESGGLSAGNITGSETVFTDAGVSIALKNAGTNSLALFDSTCKFQFNGTDNTSGTTYTPGEAACTGGDPDLGTAQALGTGPQGLVLIANEGTDTDPDDFAGTYEFEYTFSAPDGVLIEQIEMLDLDGAEDIAFSALFLGEDPDAGPVTLTEPTVDLVGTPTTDNSLRRYTFDDTRAVEVFYIEFKGTSGAVGSMEFTPRVVPVPAALPLMLGGLGLLGMIGLRRRRS